MNTVEQNEGRTQLLDEHTPISLIVGNLEFTALTSVRL